MKLKYITAMLLGIIGTSYAANEDNVVIDKIKIGKISGNEVKNDFSMMINFTNNGNEIGKWQLGFYMPRSFDVIMSQNLNPNLTMQICTMDGSCSNLRYVRNQDMHTADKSQGFLTILEPVSNFPLVAKQNYHINILNNNQGTINNYSAFPQSLFLIAIDATNKNPNKVINLTTEMDQYDLTDINQAEIEAGINSRIAKNWESGLTSKSNVLNVVPAPHEVKTMDNQAFIIPTAKQRIIIKNDMGIESSLLNNWGKILQQDWNLKYPVTTAGIDNNNTTDNSTIIIDTVAQPQLIANNAEGYILTIDGQTIRIEALTSAGVYYAFQTLRQLYQGKTELSSLQIIDYPSLDYRGVMLDVARHYFTITEIQKLIDVMASVKMNTLHIHFSDDEAFRIALTDYPTLHHIASTRGLHEDIGPNMLLQNNLDTTNLSEANYPKADSKYSGSYTPEEITQIINYANQHQITIIPEIDIPGHARALIKALPDTMIDPNDNTQTISIQGYRNNILPICTYGNTNSVGVNFTNTINTIVNQITELFNEQTTVYATNNEISLGGDEVPTNSWNDSSSCSGEWADVSAITAIDKSQLFFSKVAESNSKIKISGWQQLVQDDSAQIGKNAPTAEHTGHIWVWAPANSGVKDAIKLVDSGYPTVLAFADKAYFDIAYTPSMTEPGFTWSSKTMDSYNVLTMANDIAKVRQNVTQPGLVRGVEGTLWSENLPSFDHLIYMALPRIPALSEVAWSTDFQSKQLQQIEWQDFAKRMGCGNDGYLYYAHKTFDVNYRGYPNGIQKEIPTGELCAKKTDDTRQLNE